VKTLRTIKPEMLGDAATRAEYDAMSGEYAIAREFIAARARAGLSQTEVANRGSQTHGNHAKRCCKNRERQALSVHAHRREIRASGGRACGPADRGPSRITWFRRGKQRMPASRWSPLCESGALFLLTMRNRE